MTVLNESFSLVKDKEKIFACEARLEKDTNKYYLSILGTPNVSISATINSNNDSLPCRFAVSELNHILVSFIETLKDVNNLEILTDSRNKFFVSRAVRCQHIRPKGLLKGNVCNKLIFYSYSTNKLGGRIFCPRCQNISFI